MPSLFCRAGKKKVVLELGGNGPPAEASKAAAAARLIAVARWRHANGLLVSGVVTMVALAFLLIVSGSLIIAVHNAPQYFRGLAAAERGEIPWQEYLLVVAQGKTIAQFVAIYLGFYVLPFIVTLPASAPLIVLWREPPRFLFLRPFNRRPLTRGLSQLSRSQKVSGHLLW